MSMAAYEDQDVVFHLEVYRGYYDITHWCLGRIRECYPSSRIIVVSDGDPDPRYLEFLKYDVELEYGSHLYTPEKCGPLWIRRFSNYLKKPAKYLFRVDSDVGFYRRFSALPEWKCVFGTPCDDFIQGGMIGLTTDAIVDILGSGLLGASWVRDCRHDVSGVPMASDDQAIGKAAQLLQIPLVRHPEFHCTWQDRVPNHRLQYAVIHPCKDGRL
jgi:hypothetical protein